VLLLARHFDRELHDFEAAQRDLVRRIERSDVASPEPRVQTASYPRGVSPHLRGVVEASSDVAGISVFDASGH